MTGEWRYPGRPVDVEEPARREGEKQRNTSVGPTTKIEEFVCPPNISKTVAVRFMKLTHCLNNDQTHFKTNLTAHFINFINDFSANRRRVPQTSPR